MATELRDGRNVRHCDACWWPAKRGNKIIQWRGLADFAASQANPRPQYKLWDIHEGCARELGLR